MSTQTDGATGLPSSIATAQRLRQYMGDKKISRAKLALASGIGRTPLGKKLDGEVGFGFDEIAAVCGALNLRWAWVTLGEGDAENPHPDGPDGGSQLPRLDSNQQPSDYQFPPLRAAS